MNARHSFSGNEAMASGYSNGMYLPNKPVSEWDIDDCAKVLCREADGRITHCLTCESKCRYGRRIVELIAPAETVEEQADEKTKAKGGFAAAHAGKSRKATIKYLRAIASGNPRAWFEANGMEIRNNTSKIRTAYRDVTPEEARKRLVEMGVEVEGMQGMPINATETPAEPPAQENPDKSPTECGTPANPVKTPETATLQIHELGARHFRYKRTEGGCVEITPNPVVIADTMADIDEICAEIKAAFEMMGGIKE